MKQAFFSIGVASILAAALAPAGSAQQPKYGWSGAETYPSTKLQFGTKPLDNAENLELLLQCRKRGTVSVWIAETSGALKPNRRVKVTLAFGRASSVRPGRTRPNELAGTPSVEAVFPVTARVFAALSKQRRFTGRHALLVTAGKWRRRFALGDMGSQATNFLRSCTRP